jgi:hypothetical protein
MGGFDRDVFWLFHLHCYLLGHWTIEAVFLACHTAATESSTILTLKCRILLAMTLHLEYRN